MKDEDEIVESENGYISIIPKCHHQFFISMASFEYTTLRYWMKLIKIIVNMMMDIYYLHGKTSVCMSLMILIRL